MEISCGETHCEVTIPHFEYGSIIGRRHISPYSILKISEAGRAAAVPMMLEIYKKSGVVYDTTFFLKWQEIEIHPAFYEPQVISSLESYFDFANKNMKLYHHFFPVGNTSQLIEDTVVNMKTNVPLLSSSILVVNVDPKSRKPVPYHTAFKEYFTAEKCRKQRSGRRPPASVHKDNEIPSTTFTRSSVISVRQVDRNNHTNQAVYADICYDCLGDAFHKSVFGNYGSIFKYDLHRMSFLYINECNLGDQIDTTVWQHKENPHIFIFHLKKGSKLICEAKFEIYKFNSTVKSKM